MAIRPIKVTCQTLALKPMPRPRPDVHNLGHCGNFVLRSSYDVLKIWHYKQIQHFQSEIISFKYAFLLKTISVVLYKLVFLLFYNTDHTIFVFFVMIF